LSSERAAAVAPQTMNAVSAIVAICRVLKPKDVIDIAIPALARRLEGADQALDEHIWNSLGTLGATRNAEVFQHMISFIIDYSKRTFSKVKCDILPRGLMNADSF
jgi:hypothetical protein